ncbi:helix-turn-helix transcriptional regulator [Streptomyces sp. Ru72]|uniref:helix-turn-helix transcriptional regulator n=1 Tax=Streptomyces sp. Ru72 TaxID=2080747 RepID=UPI0015E28E8A|nr:helix-turn-helix transcriptional regulator [Streptomyces sp. Ru72]
MDLSARIRELAGSELDLTQVRNGLDRLLRRTIGYDLAAISTVDPSTLLWTSCFVSGVDTEGSTERESVIFEGEFRGTDVNSYARLANAPVPVAGLHAATGGDITVAERYEPLLSRFGICDEVRVMLRSRTGCWGSLTLYRTRPSPPFSAADLDLLAGIVTPVADLLRLTLLRAALAAPGGLSAPPGLLLVQPTGETVTVTDDARLWLNTLDDRDRLPSAVRAVAAAVRTGDGLARAALPGRDGRWVMLHGSAAGEQIAVIVEGARPAVISEVITQAYGLTPREREITELVAQGRSTRQMATRLSISPFTVQDHLKAVYMKTGVNSRGELVATLYNRHYAPRSAVGARPSPYGWYLDDTADPRQSRSE